MKIKIFVLAKKQCGSSLHWYIPIAQRIVDALLYICSYVVLFLNLLRNLVIEGLVPVYYTICFLLLLVPTYVTAGFSLPALQIIKAASVKTPANRSALNSLHSFCCSKMYYQVERNQPSKNQTSDIRNLIPFIIRILIKIFVKSPLGWNAIF